MLHHRPGQGNRRVSARADGWPIKSGASGWRRAPSTGRFMDPPPDPSPPGESLPTVSREEVEQLLLQAQSLATEIAVTTGIDPEHREPTSAAGELGGVEPDPLAALELAAQDVAEVQNLVEPDVAEPTVDSPSTAPEAVPVVEPGATRPASPGEPEAVACSEAQPQPEAPPPPGEPAVAALEAEPREAKERAPAGPEATGTQAQEAGDAGHESSTDDGGAMADAPGRAGRGKRLAAALRGAITAPALFALWLLVGGLRLLDLPFARLSPRARGMLGAIGLVTLVMGLAGLVLPRLLATNPYEHMSPYRASPAASAEEAAPQGGH
jgi:hypothetical protein